MTAAKPLARYGAVEGALASGFITAELHHPMGHDLVLTQFRTENRYALFLELLQR